MAKITLPRKEVVAEITKMATKCFRSFGDGQENKGSLLGAVLKDGPPIFALGVNISEVVTMVLLAAVNHKSLQKDEKANPENAIALTLDEAFEMREASYVKGESADLGEYKRDITDCLIEAGKANGLTDNMWVLLNLAMHWDNDCQSWSEDVLAGKNILEECKEDAKRMKAEFRDVCEEEIED